MLARKFRLTGSTNFKRVEKEGIVRQSSSFGVAVLDRKDTLPSRFAFVVSTKIAKAAVDRNRFKRAMSEAVRLSTIDLNSGFDVVFLAKTSIVKVPTAQVMIEVKAALKNFGLLKQ